MPDKTVKGLQLLNVLFIFALVSACAGAPAAPTLAPTSAPTLPPPTSPPTQPPPTQAPTQAVGTGISKICLIVGVAGITGFNGYSYQGMQSIAKEYGIESVYFSVPETAPTLQPCLDSKAQVIVTAGFAYVDATLASAQANPEIYFVGVDHFVNNGPKNLVGIQSRDDEAGFLMGYLAGLVTQSNVVAGVYGPDYPALKRFRNGYEQGARLAGTEANKPIKTLGIYLPNFTDAPGGEAAAKDFVTQGADVFFGAAGLGGTSALKYAVQQQKHVIGVDEDEYFSTFEGGKVAGANYLISSALKRVDVGVYDMLKVLVEGRLNEFPGGGNYVLSTANGGIGFAGPHDADIPEEVYDKVVDVSTRLAEGKVATGVDPTTGDLLKP